MNIILCYTSLNSLVTVHGVTNVQGFAIQRLENPKTQIVGVC